MSPRAPLRITSERASPCRVGTELSDVWRRLFQSAWADEGPRSDGKAIAVGAFSVPDVEAADATGANVGSYPLLRYRLELSFGLAWA